jgi:hypothetical protein
MPTAVGYAASQVNASDFSDFYRRRRRAPFPDFASSVTVTDMNFAIVEIPEPWQSPAAATTIITTATAAALDTALRILLA